MAILNDFQLLSIFFRVEKGKRGQPIGRRLPSSAKRKKEEEEEYTPSCRGDLCDVAWKGTGGVFGQGSVGRRALRGEKKRGKRKKGGGVISALKKRWASSPESARDVDSWDLKKEGKKKREKKKRTMRVKNAGVTASP